MDNVLSRLNYGLQRALETDQRVYIIGEDILDPYGGAFKVMRGLSTKFPDRILTTPISEAAIIGVATGMAFRGLRPVAEIMFGDFIPLIADQLINHAAKFRWIYNDQVRVPIVIRTPMGGRRGYGPTHSQSLEKMIMGVPGIKVVAPNTLFDPAELLAASIADDDPVVYIEHKLLYRCPLLLLGKGDMVDFQVERTNGTFPAFIIHSVEDAQLSIACYGNNFELCRAAAIELLMDHEIFVEIILFSQLNPFELEPLFTSLRKTRNLLTVEEGTLSVGWGAEVAARAVENMEGLRVRRLAALDLPVANAKSLEDAILPSVQDIVRVALSMVGK